MSKHMRNNLVVQLPSQSSLQNVKLVLAYEGIERGKGMGETFADLVMSAIDVDSYPEEMRIRVAEFGKQSAAID